MVVVTVSTSCPIRSDIKVYRYFLTYMSSGSLTMSSRLINAKIINLYFVYHSLSIALIDITYIYGFSNDP